VAGTTIEVEWLRELFADDATRLTWPEVRGRRKKAGLTRSGIHEALRELEFAGELECDRRAADASAWVWRRKSLQRDAGVGGEALAGDVATAVVDRDELIDLLDSARRLTHPDVSKAVNANEVTARLNVMVDRLRGR
jgi:hypothetical protein